MHSACRPRTVTRPAIALSSPRGPLALIAARRVGRVSRDWIRKWRWVIVTVAAEGLVVLAFALGPALLDSLPSRAPAPVARSGPLSIVGVHTRLSDEVEEAKIRRTTRMVREMGADWMVELFPWSYIEPRPDEYDWKHTDVVVDAAAAEGLTLVARLDIVPDWARPKDRTNRYLDAEHYDDYAEFVGDFVARYRGRVRYVVIWNEQNTSFEWGYRPVDPVEYTRLLAAAYARAKAANPDVLVLPGGLAPTLEESALALNDLTYLQRMYDAGAGRYFDVMNVHAYGWQSPPDEPAGPDRLNFARVELVRELMVRNGDVAKPILITESGWNDHPRWTKAVRPAQRTSYTVRALEKARTEWPYVVGVSSWVFRLPAPARNYNDYFTFLDTEFRPRPIYEAVRQYAFGLR